MTSRRPLPGELEPIERASLDELRALQLERMQWSLQHAYDNVPHYRRAFDAKGVHPGDLKSSPTSRKFPFTVKSDLRDNYPFGMFAVPREQRRAHPRVVGNDRQADRRRLHARTTSTPGPTWSRARSAPPAAGPATSSTSPTATASSPAASARTTAPSAPAAP